MTKLLITGASGLLGANLVLESAQSHEVTALYLKHPVRLGGIETAALDLNDYEEVLEFFSDVSPDWVIHCAAETNVDRCEQDHDHAHRINHFMARSVSRAAFSAGAELLHISTDAVFDGESEANHENQTPQPINVYGESKLEGERAVSEEHPGALIVRTNFYGWNAQDKSSLAEFFLQNLENGESCRGFIDVKVKTLLVNDLCKILLKMIESDLAGIFHVVAGNCMSKYEFGVTLAREFGLAGDLIEAVAVDEIGLSAKRPKNLCLSTTKLEQVLQIGLPTIEEGLRRLKTLREMGYPDRLKSMIGGD
ncbi:MAG: SDR family oxidoreductase [Anaerolineales bacterium]|nr:SDR family oxidoreductase [Anaerolineales bacterium]